MENTVRVNDEFIARPVTLYNYVTEEYVRLTEDSPKVAKGQRVIPVVSFKQRIGYRIVCKKVKYTFLKLHIAETNTTVKVNIRDFIEKKYKGREINKSLLEIIMRKISKKILVKLVDDSWKIVNYDNLFVK